MQPDTNTIPLSPHREEYTDHITHYLGNTPTEERYEQHSCVAMVMVQLIHTRLPFLSIIITDRVATSYQNSQHYYWQLLATANHEIYLITTVHIGGGDNNWKVVMIEVAKQLIICTM